MKFSCLQENLSKGLQTVSKAIPTKSSLPILSNVLLSAENGRLKLAATNLETAIVTYIGASIEEEGTLTVPAKLLRDFITNLNPDTLELHTKDDILYVNSKNTKSKFNGVASSDYPELPTFPEDGNVIELNAKEFSAAISIVAFSSGIDESRPIFTGVYLSCVDGKLTFAATDGFRLSEKLVKLTGEGTPNFTAIIPSKTLVEVARIFSNSAETIKFVLSESENLALFKSEETLIATRILDGQYPDYKRIIPVETSLKANFIAADFLEAVKLTNIFAKEGNSALKIRFDPEVGIRVLTMSGESGEHVSELAAEIDGSLTEVAFSSRYLLDFLNNVKAQRVEFITNGNTSPCILRSEDIEDFIHIIMPMQI